MPDYPPLDWEQMYRDGIAPWDDPTPWPPLQALVEANCAAGDSVLEVGCGLGSDAIHLASLGYRVTATDLSEAAIAKAQEAARDAGAEIEFSVEDFYRHSDPAKYDLVYEKGVMVNAENAAVRERFARTMAARLKSGGAWISVCGSAGNLNRDGSGPDKRGYPRLSLQEISAAVESHFEVQAVTKELFGSLPENSFMSWVVVARPRRTPAAVR